MVIPFNDVHDDPVSRGWRNDCRRTTTGQGVYKYLVPENWDHRKSQRHLLTVLVNYTHCIEDLNRGQACCGIVESWLGSSSTFRAAKLSVEQAGSGVKQAGIPTVADRSSLSDIRSTKHINWSRHKRFLPDLF